MSAAQGGITRSSRKRQHPVGSMPCQLSGQVGRSTMQSRQARVSAVDPAEQQLTICTVFRRNTITRLKLGLSV